MSRPTLVLASASPRRSELLRSIGLEFEVVPSRAEELHDESMPLGELCAVNAELKAREVARAHSESIVIGADTLVGLRGKLFGKPRDLEEAAQMLRDLSGQTHQVTTAVCLIYKQKIETFVERTDVTFRPLKDSVITDYLQSVAVLDKAGAYGIQERGELLVQKIEGSFTNVVGFPTERFIKELTKFGITVEG